MIRCMFAFMRSMGVFLSIAGIPGGLAAQEARSVTLTEAVAASLANGPGLVQVDRDLALRLADAIEAETRANPEVGIDARLSEKGAGVGLEVEIEQPLRWSDFRLRPVYATAIRQAASLEQEAALFDLVAETSELYVRLWAVQERFALAERAAAEADEITARLNEIRQAANLPVVRFNVFEPEALRRSEDARLHAAERDLLNARLGAATGLNGVAIDTTTPGLMPLPGLDRLLAFAAARDYGARLARARITVNEARLAVAEKDRWPGLTPRASYEIEPGGDARNWGVGVALEIPLWDTNQAEQARARANLTAARAHLAILESGQRDGLISGLYARARLMADRAANYRDGIVPAYRRTYGDLRAMFDQGQADLLELWQVQAALLDAEEDSIATVRAALEARIALERAIGGKIEEVR